MGTAARPDGGRRGLHGMLVEDLGRRIAAGQIAAGDVIATESIGHAFGVSRTVVREALRVLEGKGMVFARPRTGTRVTSVGRWDLLDPDVIAWRAMGPDCAGQFDELMALRAGVEPLAAHDCALQAGTEVLDRLVDEADRMRRAVDAGDPHAFNQADVAFHEALFAGSGNVVFQQIFSAVAALLRVREALHLLEPHHLGRHAVQSHEALAVAIENRRAEDALAISTAMVSHARREIAESLSNAEQPQTQNVRK